MTEITITPGATHSPILVAIQALIHAGDEVIIFDPVMTVMGPAYKLVGAKAIHIPLTAPQFSVD